MITGVCNIPRVVEESICRSSKDYRFTELGVYKVHSTALMPEIPFEEASIISRRIDKGVFVNDDETMPTFNPTIKTQNFLSTRYVGRAPLEWYDNGEVTKMGRQFLMVCRGGNPNKEYRIFGTEAAIRGYNRSANDNVKLPGGGEEV